MSRVRARARLTGAHPDARPDLSAAPGPAAPAGAFVRGATPARVVARGAAVLAGLLTVLLSAGPSFAANDELGPREGADIGSGLSVGATIVIFVLLPAFILLGVAALVWLPGLVKADRYRPQRGWSAAPVWFAGPPDPVAAVETAEVGASGRGGASGNW